MRTTKALKCKSLKYGFSKEKNIRIREKREEKRNEGNRKGNKDIEKA